MAVIVLPKRIIWNEGSADALVALASDLDASKILVVTDKVIRGLDWFNTIMDTLASNGLDVEVYDEVDPEPSLEVADKVANAIQRVEPDLLLAVGGGSVIDAAKAGKIRFLRPDTSIEDIAPFNPLRIEFEKPILVAMPTTAGTGSDASFGIVLTKVGERGREKIDVASYDIVPYATILDPRLPRSAPRSIIVGAALDALGHALEALVANQANPFTDALAEKVVPVIMTGLKEALEGEMDRMAEVHMAATMAGIAFTNGGLGLIHAIAHPLGAKLRIHHGTMVGIVIPAVVKYNYKDEYSRKKYEMVKTILESVYGLEPQDTLYGHILAFYKGIGFKHRIRDYGVERSRFEEVIDLVVEEAYHDPSIAYARLIPTPEELRELLESLY
ncbi:MAG: iron-containing alcohol dehydrogenase [Desulfurococcales archaeon]|nr:iron-containing alcohol dehydrogenase [Desulfurococcales archaeon]